MSQQIAITQTENIRPVFAHGVAENIKRYNQLKQLFAHSGAYKLLAEPAPAGGDKVSWTTEFNGNLIRLTDLEETQQAKALGRLKHQVNEMYRSALVHIPEPKKEKSKELFDVIDACIEIPHEQFINIIQEPTGKQHFVIHQWGFTFDDFNATTGIIAKLVPTKIADYTLLVLDDDNKPLPEKRITLEFLNRVKNYVTDQSGKIYLEDFSLFSAVVAYVRSENGNKDYLHQYQCAENAEWIMRIGRKRTTYQFRLTDENNQPLANEIIWFEIEGEIQQLQTNENGLVKVNNIVEGSEIGYFQEGKPVRKATCSQTDTPIEIKGFATEIADTPKPLTKEPNLPPFVRKQTTPANTTLQIRVVNKKQKPIENVRVDVKGQNTSLTQVTPTDGNLSVPAAIGDTFDIKLIYKKKTQQHQITCSENNQLTILQINEKRIWWLWLILLLLLVLAGYLIYQNFFNGAPPHPIVPPTDSTTTVVDLRPRMQLNIKDKETNQPVALAQIILKADSLSPTNQTSDSVGMAVFLFDNLPTELSATITAPNYLPYNTTLEYAAEKTVYISKEKSTEVFEKPLPCGTEALSGGFGTTVKVFRMGQTNGVFDLYFAPYELPDKITIYSGRPDKMTKENIVWTTGPEGVSGKKTFEIKFVSPDSLITVETEGLVGETKWKYKVNCPK